MDRNDLYRSFNEIDDEVLYRSEKAGPRAGAKRRLLGKRLAAIAACVAILLGVTLTAEATTGSVSNFFAPYFGFAQADLVDAIGRPIGASVSADGYTLTAEAVVGDRYNVAVVYTLRRDDGQPITEKLSFQGWESNVLFGFFSSGGSGSLSPIEDPDHPDQISFLELWSGSSPLFGRYVTVSFSDLSIYREGEDSTVVAEGPWELSYTLRYRDSTQKVPVNRLNVTAEDGRRYQVNQILLSPVGLHLQGVYFDPVWGEQKVLDEFKVSIKKENGTVLPLEDASGGCSFSEYDTSADFHFEAIFPAPIPLDEISALIICGEEVPIR